MLVLAVAFSVACGAGDSSDGKATPTPPNDAQAIRQVDFTKNADVMTTLRQLPGGSVLPKEIVYGDVTGDRREEAIVPISSQGTLGNLAYLVFTMKGSSPALVLTRGLGGGSGGISMKLDEGKLVELAPELGPEDPLCCPSATRKTTFRWDGAKFQVEREEKLEGTGQNKG